MAARVFRIAQIIAVNAVPVFGFFGGAWTAGTVLALYWFENLAASILIAIRVYIHRKLTNKRGHYVLNVTRTTTTIRGRSSTETKRSVGTLLQGFLLVAVGFTIGHAIFVAVIISQLPESARFDMAQFRLGVLSITAFLLIGFILDLGGIGQRQFGWIRQMTANMLARVLVIHLTAVIGIGLAALFNSPRAAIALFITLKILLEIAAQMPQKESPAEDELPFDAEARARLLASESGGATAARLPAAQ